MIHDTHFPAALSQVKTHMVPSMSPTAINVMNLFLEVRGFASCSTHMNLMLITRNKRSFTGSAGVAVISRYWLQAGNESRLLMISGTGSPFSFHEFKKGPELALMHG